MKIKDFAEKLDLKVLTNYDGEKEIVGCYCGDLLSSYSVSTLRSNFSAKSLIFIFFTHIFILHFHSERCRKPIIFTADSDVM